MWASKNDVNNIGRALRELEKSVESKAEASELRVSENITDLKLLTKDVKASIGGMQKFMELFKEHDEKEMEKYDTINSNISSIQTNFTDEIHSVNNKLDSYMSVTEKHSESIKSLQVSAEEGSLYVKKVTWTIGLLTSFVTVLWLMFPVVNDYMENKIRRDMQIEYNSKSVIYSKE